MYTGDEELDDMYLYHPQNLTHGDLLRAVRTRFPKQLHLLQLSREELLDFYMAQILPCPQKVRCRNTSRNALQAFENGKEKEGNREEEQKTWFHPGEIPIFQRQNFSHSPDYYLPEPDPNKRFLEADSTFGRNVQDLDHAETAMESGFPLENPEPFANEHNHLKRSFPDDSNEMEPTKRLRSEIDWP